MGAIIFAKGAFADHLHEIIGYKAGLAASIEHMCDLLVETGEADDIIRSETYGIRIRAEDYESLYYNLLHKIGVTEKPYQGIFSLIDLRRDIAQSRGEKFAEEIFQIYFSGSEKAMESAIREGGKSLDPTEMLSSAYQKHGEKGVVALFSILEEVERMRTLSPHVRSRHREWDNVLDLGTLFSKYQKNSTYGEHFDQRFIDFLSVNYEKLGVIHWRKFEELVSECFVKFGFHVEIGPGTNDDGVDVRVWNDQSSSCPKYIIQCKRQKSTINKVTVKGLYADVIEEGAEMGLLITTSEFSPGARQTVSVRGYPVEEVNGKMISEWLRLLRTPGTGIIRV